MPGSEFRNVFLRMIGGDEDFFLKNHWRQRVLFTKKALPELAYTYSCSQFIEDYLRMDPWDESLVVSIDNLGVRRMVKPAPGWGSSQELQKGTSLVLQALLLASKPKRIVPAWRKFIDMHEDICKYMLPDMPSGFQPGGAIAAVDIFCTTETTSTGGHYDTGDVFYFVLDGKKEWIVELIPDPQAVMKLLRSRGGYMLDHVSRREHLNIMIEPGDCLYVPPYTYHRVSSCGQSLAVSLGLPAYTEATLLRAKLERLQLSRAICDPLPSFPRSSGHLFEESKRETIRRLNLFMEAMQEDKIELDV